MAKKILWGFLFWFLSYIGIGVILTLIGVKGDTAIYISMILAIPATFFLTKRKLQKNAEKEERLNESKKKLSEIISMDVSNIDFKNMFKNVQEKEQIKSAVFSSLYSYALKQDWDKFKELLELSKELGISIDKIDLYKKLIEIFIRDGELSEIEKETLLKVKDILGISDKDAKKLYSMIVTNFISNELRKIFEDNMVTPEEKEYIERLTKGLNIELDEKTQKRIEDLYSVYLMMNQPLNPIPCPINLQKNEECYFEIQKAELQKWKKEKVSYGGIGLSFKVAKGVRFYTGTGRITSSQDVLKTEDIGSIYITNKRFIFVGQKKTTSIKLDKILDFNIYEDEGVIEIKKETGPALIFRPLTDVNFFYLSAVLNRLMRENS
ncbi:MAG: hypothetical protein DSY47_00040 [Hydrogenothermus sp.]|nr:MAG: hypothetical protein DSY47_00040 [Hydrogenothermus sp.]